MPQGDEGVGGGVRGGVAGARRCGARARLGRAGRHGAAVAGAAARLWRRRVMRRPAAAPCRQ